MLTRNYWMLTAAYLVNKLGEVKGNETTKPKLITVSGDVASDVYSSNNYRAVSDYILGAGLPGMMRNVRTVDVSNDVTDKTGSNHFSYGAFFGSGNTPATVDDYKLSGDVIQNISYSYSENHTYEEDGSAGVAELVYTITNNNDTEITIGEIGLFGEAYWLTTYNLYTHFYYLFERTALETPITIAPGGVGQVTYAIRMSYPVT